MKFNSLISRVKRKMKIFRVRTIITAHQLANTTKVDRYPEIFLTVKDLHILSYPKILSFGCSTGEECFTLRQYFTSADIIGLDVDIENIKVAKSQMLDKNGYIVFDTSSELSLKKHGPYDIIFCMSVLCRWPETENLDDCSSIYSFTKFEDQIKILDRYLTVNGVLVIYNANFLFMETQISRFYNPIALFCDKG